MGAVAPSGDHSDAIDGPEVLDPLRALSGMLGGVDLGAAVAAVTRQFPVDADYGDQLEALRSEVAALRRDLAPVIAAFGALMNMPKVKRALSRVDV